MSKKRNYKIKHFAQSVFLKIAKVSFLVFWVLKWKSIVYRKPSFKLPGGAGGGGGYFFLNALR